MSNNLIEFLSNFGNVEDKITNLKDSFGITATNDDLLPNLYSLNYHMTDSPKTHPIVRECRSIIVDLENDKVVARSFNRFYNLGEAKNIIEIELGDNSVATEKIDGSLFMLYNYNGIWYPATRKTTTARNSFMKVHNGVDNVAIPMLQIIQEYFDIDIVWDIDSTECSGNWVTEESYDAFIKLLQDKLETLNKDYTYVCEIVSPYNTVVSKFANSDIYLLTIMDKEGNTIDSDTTIFSIPEARKVQSEEDIYEFIKYLQSVRDYLVEGVVVMDNNSNLAKIKSSVYVAVHLAGSELPTTNSIIKVVAAFEEDEYLTYFPEHSELLLPFITKRDSLIADTNTAYEYALLLKSNGSNNKVIVQALLGNYNKNAVSIVMAALNTEKPITYNPGILGKNIR